MKTPLRLLAAFALIGIAAVAIHHLIANPGSVQPFTFSVTGPASQKLTWNSQPGARYVVQVSNNLGGWNDVDVVTATGTTTMWNDPFPRLVPKGFYRLVTPQPEVRSVHPSVLSTTAATTVYFLGQCFTGTELFYLNGALTAGLVFDSMTQLHIVLPPQPAGIYELKITDATSVPLAGGTVTVISNLQGLRLEGPPIRIVPNDPDFDLIRVQPNAAQMATLEFTVEDFRYRACGVCPSNGEIRGRSIDLHVRGVGLDFTFSRTYRSRLGTSTPMGEGWDFSYNIRAQKNSPASVTVFNGDGRADVFTLGAGGVFDCPERFESGMLNGGGTVFTLTFPGGGKWEFGAFGALPGPANLARVSAIRDRNNNAITFAYDPPTGRLMTITDTVGHAYTLAYSGAGYIDTLTDFAGRVVTYTHDANGDLTVVRSPAVVGTPNGNDFPAGKTMSYTYSSGFADPRLNHNLLTITDGLGQTPVVFTYAPTLVPTDLEFDRVAVAQIGNAGQDEFYTYERLTPSPANLFTVVKTYVNDRNGHLTEYEYDSLNRPVRVRRYTGSCVPGVAVTAVANRPGAPLRAGDPAFYTSRAEWNSDSLCTKTTMPRGNTIEFFHEVDLRTAGSVPARNKARLLLHRQRADVLGVYDQDEIVMRFVHDERFGTGRGVAFPTQLIDGRGYATQMGYDVRGNLLSVDRALVLASPAAPAGGVIQIADYTYNAAGQCISALGPHNGTVRRLDTFTYYGAGPQAGWLASTKVNDGGLNLITTYEYNTVGCLVRTVDPRGNDTLTTCNALNQPVRVESRSAGAAGRGRIHIFYDANNNVVRTDTLNKDHNGVVQPNAEFTSTWTYDVLNMPLSTTVEIDAATTATAEFIYDPNRNLTAVRSPEAVAGAQPDNTVRFTHDERDKPYRITLAFGTPAQSTTQYDYDANGCVVTTTQGIEGATPRVWTFESDPFAGDPPPFAPPPGPYIPDVWRIDPVPWNREPSPGLSLAGIELPDDPNFNPYTGEGISVAYGLDGRPVQGQGLPQTTYGTPTKKLPPLLLEPPDVPGSGGGGLLWDPPRDPLTPPSVSSGADTSGWLVDPIRPPAPFVPSCRPVTGFDFSLDVTNPYAPQVLWNLPASDNGMVDLFNSAAARAAGALADSKNAPLFEAYTRGMLGNLKTATLPTFNRGYRASKLGSNLVGLNLGRLTGVTDPMGNRVEFHYDAAGNRVRTLHFGEMNDVPGSTNNVRLAERTVAFDPLNRPVAVNDAHFNPATGLNIGDGQRTTIYEWTDAGALKRHTDDRGNQTLHTYDTGGWLDTVTDPRGNLIDVIRDANGNVTTVTSTEKSDLASPDQVFIVTFGYDARDHCTSRVDGVGNTDTYAYDSRGFPRMHINPRGVAGFSVPDGLYRVTLSYRDMDGSGTLNPADIQHAVAFDLNTRPVSITDDNGNSTQYLYDSLNRPVRVTLADGTQTNSVFDVHHNVTQRTDANGTQVNAQFDRNNRPAMLQVIPGPGVAPTTTQRTFSYEGRGLVVAAMTSGNGFGGPIMHQCALSHDSHGNVLTDTQDALTTASTYDGVGNRTQLVHPTGRVVNYAYDALNRCSTIQDGGPVGAFFYFGPDRLERIANGNGTRTDFVWDGVNGVPNPPGDFGFRRIIEMTHTHVMSATAIDARTYTWDRNQNKTQRRDMRAGGPQLTHSYGYDNDDRLTGTQVVAPGPVIVRQTNYQLDGVNNRQNVAGPGTPNPGPYVMNAAGPTFDFEVNQYTNTPIGPQTHSNAGETVNIAGAQFTYDFTGTLVQYQAPAAPQPTALYDVDPFGRRVKRVLDPAGVPVVTAFGYAGGSLITENPAAGMPRDYIIGFLDADGDGLPDSWEVSNFAIRGPVNAWLHHDDLGNTMAASDAAGAAIERVEYADYGDPQLFDGAGVPIGASIVGNPFLFAVGYYNPESGLIDAAPGCMNNEDCRWTISGGWGKVNIQDLSFGGWHGAGKVNAQDLGFGGGHAGGKVNVQDIAITRATDKASSDLMRAASKGRTFNPKTGRWLTNDPLGTWSDPGANGNGKDFRHGNPWSGR